ncbi:bifunctional (p)ppGpp synthetase/guanosine-3',5'-bis(diphosphate) 3'-pyrophosphohydrolase [Blautia wexlerae]|jgi:guanosine-3',5'-bis(diphosphate) 3'-pyrophosphohydrolase|uniref:RelA/SpoT family protein n=1 Tax=Blautia wexlerae TaxID=418240 RepID=UPI000E4E8953|nr:bifunctional (p)ppGpp synthetase/guanosine-3',5'-bis(diphosphate) 3'-pyrophosphohydrolase [Blautia wexlerae]MDB6469167.1 bifunctional (p)ppGpp synthetase/guanosine-3',5'-bis(diphosphate) 3'-pyrophosphohydrolase [Blautia wexlerae]RHT13168.1 bifunctional (p)ppGpp synthetase/guanosine-3',5'-bis(diphosphate) 3'-pyrophosphohydrolase [Ruminococcus sp. AM40-10AC]RHT67989.1 bifunctional (p)ppGpp synthetase/guanosine-3',5'-bis(diphosphate) 3'-pyrophosphohydrolase [Ruminococcus sp. AM29-12LB]
MTEITKSTEAKKDEMQVEKEKLESVKRADAAVKTMHDFTSPEVLYKELINSVLKYHPSTDISMIEKAYKVASEAHEGQKRKSGEPYIIHPLCVAIILADLELDKETIVAGLLHDAVEDTWMTYEEVEKEFGSEVALLVDGVTKLGQLSYSADKVEVQAENLRKMFLAMAKDIRVILIKLADRLHNMRTLQYMRPEKQQEKARETMDIYAPIAMRLGISKIKVELDDLSLKYLKPDVYYDLVHKVALRKSEREQFVGAIVKEVKKHMDDANIKAQVDGRVKHFFSIYKKMVNQDKTIDQIYDLFAVRILVDTVKDCYAALGVIHEMYKPIPGRFKDYIAMPKPNMYQSLHTTLIGPNGQPFEIQIRTYEMHRTAEYGIAAHWKYKESSDGKAPVGKSEEEKLNWLRQILEWQRDMSDNKEFMSLLKNDLDLFADSVYCFTPQGDVKTLPSGSTPVDFAYSVHSAVGNKMVGARVNGKLVPIEYEIKNGDRIEIITSQNSQGPSRDWLKLVKSTQAKNKINQWFKKELKEDNILKGKEMLAQYARAKGFKITNYTKNQYLEAVLRKYGFRDWDSVLAAIGHGGLKEGQVFNKLVEAYDKENKKNLTDEQVLEAASETQEKLHIAKSKSGIVVKGIHDVAVRFSKCCNPIPGDEIVGFVTRGRGITIHRTDCVNVLNMSETDRTRLIEAEWQQPDTKEKEKYMAEIQVYANNRTGLLVDLSKIFTERKIDLRSINSRTSKQEKATISMSFEIGSKEELRSLIEKIRQVESVIDVERTTG